MRFTPAGQCKLLNGKVWNRREGQTQSCSLLVFDNQGGKPGTKRLGMTYTPASDGWAEVQLSTQLTYNTDFWIVVWLPLTAAPNRIGQSMDNNGFNNQGRDAYAISGYNWTVPSSDSGDYMIRAIVTYTGVEEKELVPSEQLILMENYPNPFVDKTTISYTLPKEMKVGLKIYDITGKVVRSLINSVQTAGQQRVIWDRKNESGAVVPTGVYFYRLKTNTGKLFCKVMIVL